MLLAVPALRALRAASPGGSLALAAQPRIARLLRALGVVDEALAFDALGLHALFVDAPRAARLPAIEQATRVVCWFGAGAPGFVERLRALAPGAVVASPVGDDRPVWEHLLATVGAAPEARWRAPLEIPGELLERGRRELVAAGWDGVLPLLLVHPGAGGVDKRWPTEGFARVLERVAPRIGLAVHCGPADAAPVSELMSRHRGPLLRLEAPELGALAGVLGLAAGYLGNDSGVSHLAAALGVRALVLFTATNLPWRSWSDAARPLVVATETLREADGDRVIAGLTALLR